MKKLRSLAIDRTFAKRKTSRGTIEIESLRIHFPTPQLKQIIALRESLGSLPATYQSKRVVAVDNEILFGELAILRYLQKDGWDGVWVDTFHGRGLKKVLWSSMPPNGKAGLPVHAEQIYDKIVLRNQGKSSGFFDVFAWKNSDYVFIEYKGEGDSPNENELQWIEAAISAGIKPDQMFFVSY